MIIIEFKKLNKVKNSPDGLNDRLEIWKNIKDRSIEFIHCEQQRENRWDKMNRASETCGKKNKRYNIFVTEVPEGEEKVWNGKKYLKK